MTFILKVVILNYWICFQFSAMDYGNLSRVTGIGSTPHDPDTGG